MITINGRCTKFMPLCGVAGVANLTGEPIEDVFNLFKTHFNKNGNWQGSTYLEEQLEIMRAMDVKFKDVTKDLRGTVLSKFVEFHTKPDTTYMVRTTRHIQTIRNGIITDQLGPYPVDEYWGSRKRVKNVFEIKNPYLGDGE